MPKKNFFQIISSKSAVVAFAIAISNFALMTIYIPFKLILTFFNFLAKPNIG